MIDASALQMLLLVLTGSLDVNEHAPAIDVGDLQMAQLRVSHAGRVQDHQHRAVRQTVGGVDHPLCSANIPSAR